MPTSSKGGLIQSAKHHANFCSKTTVFSIQNAKLARISCKNHQVLSSFCVCRKCVFFKNISFLRSKITPFIPPETSTNSLTGAQFHLPELMFTCRSSASLAGGRTHWLEVGFTCQGRAALTGARFQLPQRISSYGGLADTSGCQPQGQIGKIGSRYSRAHIGQGTVLSKIRPSGHSLCTTAVTNRW